jgi:hypothetical protein
MPLGEQIQSGNAGGPVWYVAYGSNLSRRRFDFYIEGGRPTGSAKVLAGRRDKSSPLQAKPFKLDQPLYFACKSSQWGGGALHSAAASERMPYDTWVRLERILPSLGWFNWDKCERLRRGLFRCFLEPRLADGCLRLGKLGSEHQGCFGREHGAEAVSPCSQKVV